MAKKPAAAKWKHLPLLGEGADGRWQILRERHAADHEAVAIIAAIGAAPAKAVQIFSELFAPYAPPPKSGGAPAKWGRSEQLCVWLAVEVEVALARYATPRVGYKSLLQRRLCTRPLLAAYNLNGPPHLEIKSVDIALRNHRAAAAILRSSPDLAAAWNGIRKAEIARRRSA